MKIFLYKKKILIFVLLTTYYLNKTCFIVVFVYILTFTILRVDIIFYYFTIPLNDLE